MMDACQVRPNPVFEFDQAGVPIAVTRPCPSVAVSILATINHKPVPLCCVLVEHHEGPHYFFMAWGPDAHLLEVIQRREAGK
jgi:hypothetical protein